MTSDGGQVIVNRNGGDSVTEQESTKVYGKVLDDPFYSDIRRDLGKEREKELIEAIEASNDDGRVLLQIFGVGVFILFLVIFVIFNTDMDPLMGIALIIVTSVPLLGLFMTWSSTRPLEATRFGEKTGKAAIPHYEWLKFRVRYGFWKAVIIQIVLSLSIMALAMICIFSFR